MARGRKLVGMAGTILLISAVLLPGILMASSADVHGGAGTALRQEPLRSRTLQDYWIYPSATASATKAPPGTIVTFDGSSSFAYPYDIVRYTWNVSDGKVWFELVGETVQHNFTKLGNYTITMTVMDSQGHRDSTIQLTLLIANHLENVPPVALAMFYGGTPTIRTQTVCFDGRMSSDDCGISSYVWTIHDGGFVTVQTGAWPIYYAFLWTGLQNVTLTVTDVLGLNDSTTIWIDVIDPPPPPVAEAGPDQTVNMGTTVMFNGSGSHTQAGYLYYYWHIVDILPVTLDGEFANFTFTRPGDYEVTLEVWDGLGNQAFDTMTVHVTVPEGVPPVADAGEDIAAKVGEPVVFDGSGSTGGGSMTFLWNFKYNGTYEVMYGENPEFTFDIPGEYSVTLTVTNDSGLSGADMVIVNVTDGGTWMERWGVLAAFEGACAAAVIALLVYWARLRMK